MLKMMPAVAPAAPQACTVVLQVLALHGTIDEDQLLLQLYVEAEQVSGERVCPLGLCNAALCLATQQGVYGWAGRRC